MLLLVHLKLGNESVQHKTALRAEQRLRAQDASTSRMQPQTQARYGDMDSIWTLRVVISVVVSVQRSDQCAVTDINDGVLLTSKPQMWKEAVEKPRNTVLMVGSKDTCLLAHRSADDMRVR